MHFSGVASELSVVTHVLTASIAGGIGYLFGGMFAVAKVSDLYVRLDVAERGLASHVHIVAELTSVLQLLLGEVENSAGHSPSIQKARRLLSTI